MKLDYSALDQPVTQADIDAYQIVYGERTFALSKPALIAIIVMASVLVGVGVVSIMAGRPEAVGMLIMQAIIGGALLIAFIQARRSRAQRRAKVYKFALANDARLVLETSDPHYPGLIFDEGHSRSIVDAVQFPGGVEIGNFMYITGHGKNASEHHWGYARVTLTRRLPHMVLDARSNDIFGKISNLPDSFRGQTLSLEGDFDKYFKLYVPQEYQRDALYVLTPDVMAALIDTGSAHDIEIIDDQLYIYGPALDLGQRSSVESIMAIIDKIGSELIAQTDRYADERVDNRAANIVAEPGRRLRKYLSLGQILIIVAALAFMLYTILSQM